jgi:S-adenosylmethionine uptake transporter
MLAAALCFSVMGALVKSVGHRFSGFELLAWRGLVGMVVLGGWIIHKRLSLLTERPGAHLSRSLVGTLSILCFFYSLVHLPLATSLTLNYSSPLFMAAFLVATGALAGSRRWLFLLPILGGFAGVLLMMQPTIERQDIGGLAAGLFGGATGATAYLLVKSLGRSGEPEWRVVFYFSVVNAVVGIIAASFTGWHKLDGPGLLTIVGIGLLALAGQVMMTRAFGQGRTLVVGALQYSGIMFAGLIGWLVFAEALDALEWWGIALIAASGVAATMLSNRQDQSQPLKAQSAGEA